jgi:putative transposase
VERNPLRAGLVRRAEDWCWGSLWRRAPREAEPPVVLGDWPVTLPSNWVECVNASQTTAEEEAMRRCTQRGHPFGSDPWVQEVVERFALASTMHKRDMNLKTPSGANTSYRTGLSRGGRHGFYLSHKVP